MNKIKNMSRKKKTAICAVIIAIILALIFGLCMPKKTKKKVKKIEQVDVTNACDIVLDSSYYTYTGKPIRPKVRLVFGDLESGTLDVKKSQYKVKYSNNINPGMATVTVISKGVRLKGSHTRTFFITKSKMSKIASPLYTVAGTRKFFGSMPGMMAARDLAAYCDSNISEAQIKSDLYAWRRTLTKQQFMEFYKSWGGLVCGMDFMYDDAKEENFAGYKDQFTALGCYKEVKSHMNARGRKNWKIIKKYLPDVAPETTHDLPLQEAVE